MATLKDNLFYWHEEYPGLVNIQHWKAVHVSRLIKLLAEVDGRPLEGVVNGIDFVYYDDGAGHFDKGQCITLTTTVKGDIKCYAYEVPLCVEYRLDKLGKEPVAEMLNMLQQAVANNLVTQMPVGYDSWEAYEMALYSQCKE